MHTVQRPLWTETPRQRPLARNPHTETPRQRPPGHRLSQTETPLEGTWHQAARQEVTSYRDPSEQTNRCKNSTLPQTFFAGSNNAQTENRTIQLYLRYYLVAGEDGTDVLRGKTNQWESSRKYTYIFFSKFFCVPCAGYG